MSVVIEFHFPKAQINRVLKLDSNLVRIKIFRMVFQWS